ncbi:TOPRIM nucleotidyl transferase/hydrolase domain-containing protein, partial [Streptomyces sp. NPDC058685]|uniref:TOPRIM nucleotidyl transferase/hydrolase domain-containing protein n=1 Tax=Streptomyces sp. NPDC058685 TaxID=3346598 RepID=UPI0036526B02
MTRFRLAVVECAAGGERAAEAEAVAQRLAVDVRTVVLVEGDSDRIALEVLAARSGRRLDAEGISVVPLGGATSIGRFLKMFGPQGIDVRPPRPSDAREAGILHHTPGDAGVGTRPTP